MTLAVSVGVDSGDGQVTFTLRAENDGADPVDLTFGSGQTAEFVVATTDDVVWRWSDERMFTQQVRHETLAPGDAIVAEAGWADPPPGTYTVEASLASVDRTPSASATFSV